MVSQEVCILHIQYFFGVMRNKLQKQPLDMFCKKGVLKNFVISLIKHLCQSLFFNKVTGLRSATSSKKRLWHRCFSVNFAKFLRAPFVQNTSGDYFSGRLLLKLQRLYILFNSERLLLKLQTLYLELIKRRSKVQE